MNYNKLEENNFHEIKQSILDPDSSPLSPTQQQILERWVSAGRTLDRYPTIKNAVKIHQAKYQGLSRAQAYRDVKQAGRLFNSFHKFYYDFWHEWLLSDIVDQINNAKAKNDLMAWHSGHMALLKAIGKRPEVETDPKLVEKHKFVFQADWNNHTLNIDLSFINKIPKRERERLVADLFHEIDEETAREIMNS